jgi:hypothetical protein
MRNATWPQRSGAGRANGPLLALISAGSPRTRPKFDVAASGEGHQHG